MKVSVYDTFVPKSKNIEMHFDILVEEGTSVKKVYGYGESYLENKGILKVELSTKECKFCHIEKAPVDVQMEIGTKGFSIIEIENC
jgi:hypothetical protein